MARFLLLAGVGLSLLVLSGPHAPSRAQSADEYFSRAVSRYVNHQHEKARELLSKALELNPRHANARRLYEQLGGRSDHPDTPSRPSELTDTSARPSIPPRSGPRRNEKARTSPDTGEPVPRAHDSHAAPPATRVTRVQPDDTGSAATTPPPSEVSSNRRVVFANPSDASGEGIPSLTRLTAKQYPDRVLLKLEATRPVDVIVSRMREPPLLVLDVPGSRSQLTSSPLELNMDPVVRIRHSLFRDQPFPTTRLVLSLTSESVAHRLHQTRSQPEIVVEVYRASSETVKKKSPEASTPVSRSEASTSP